MPTIQANGAEFYYELHGKGQPLILISGYTCDHQFWIPVLDNLSKHFQVLIFDNRAIGQTKDTNEKLSVELMAQDVMALAKTLDLSSPHIVGQSMGGTIAQCIASQYPKEINKLALINTSAKWRLAILLSLKAALMLKKQNVSLEIIIEIVLPWLFGDVFLSNEKQVKAFKKALIENPYPQTLEDQTRQFEVLKNFDGQNKLKSIQAPTLIAYGIEDLISLPGESHFLANQITGAKLSAYESGHGLPLELPNELSKSLLDFLKK